MPTSVLLRLYVPTNEHHCDQLLFEWVLERAKALGLRGGSAFRAIAGFGRHGVLHQEGFFDIAANLPLQVEFVAEENQARQLINLLRAEHISVPYVLTEVEFGFTAAAGRA
jgi:PII-like signaling protein